MMAGTFPQEIWLMVVEFLPDDPTTLRRMGKTCQMLGRMTMPLLWRKKVLPKSRLPSLFRFLVEHPRLSALVREITLKDVHYRCKVGRLDEQTLPKPPLPDFQCLKTRLRNSSPQLARLADVFDQVVLPDDLKVELLMDRTNRHYCAHALAILRLCPNVETINFILRDVNKLRGLLYRALSHDANNFVPGLRKLVVKRHIYKCSFADNHSAPSRHVVLSQGKQPLIMPILNLLSLPKMESFHGTMVSDRVLADWCVSNPYLPSPPRLVLRKVVLRYTTICPETLDNLCSSCPALEVLKIDWEKSFSQRGISFREMTAIIAKSTTLKQLGLSFDDLSWPEPHEQTEIADMTGLINLQHLQLPAEALWAADGDTYRHRLPTSLKSLTLKGRHSRTWKLGEWNRTWNSIDQFLKRIYMD